MENGKREGIIHLANAVKRCMLKYDMDMKE